MSDPVEKDEAAGLAKPKVAPSTLSFTQIQEALDLMMSTGDINHRLGEAPEEFDILEPMDHGVGLESSEGFADYFVVSNG